MKYPPPHDTDPPGDARHPIHIGIGRLRLTAPALACTIYRQGDPKHPLISSPPVPSSTHRWRGRNDAERICGSRNPDSPWVELIRTLGPGVDPSTIKKRCYGSIACALDTVLDLCDPKVRLALAIPLRVLLGDDLETTRLIAAAAEAHGFDAIVSPSAVVPGDTTVVVLPAGIPKIRVIETAEALPFTIDPRGAAG